MLLLIENTRYIGYLEEVGIFLSKIDIITDVGRLVVYEDTDKALSIIDVGKQNDIEYHHYVPKAVLAYMQSRKKKIEHLGLLCKAGGINPLLSVGDVVFAGDYIDFTGYERYPFRHQPESVVERDMSAPFSDKWVKSCINKMGNWRAEYGVNVLRSATIVCTQGPFFESTAEIEAFRLMKADIVAHSVCPYVYYAKKLSISYIVLAVISNMYGRTDKVFINNRENNVMISKLAGIMVSAK